MKTRGAKIADVFLTVAKEVGVNRFSKRSAVSAGQLP
jgi:hypothetical protein